MDIFASFATDEKKEEEGTVVFLTSGKDLAKDPWIKVARLNNTQYAKAVAEGHAKVQADKKLLRMSDEQAEIIGKNVMIEVLADTVLKGFGNLTFQGDVLPPGRESHLTFLRVKDFRELVVGHAADVDLFRVAAAEEASGN